MPFSMTSCISSNKGRLILIDQVAAHFYNRVGAVIDDLIREIHAVKVRILRKGLKQLICNLLTSTLRNQRRSMVGKRPPTGYTTPLTDSLMNFFVTAYHSTATAFTGNYSSSSLFTIP